MVTEEKFFREYIDLIAAMGKRLTSFSWWACPISSKNRFYRPFVDILRGATDASKRPGLFRHLVGEVARIVAGRILRGRKVRRVVAGHKGKKIVLLKTFAFKNTPLRPFEDPFWGCLPSFLKDKGHAVVTLCEPLYCFKNSVTKIDADDAVLSCHDFLKLTDLFCCLGKLFKDYLVVRKKNISLSFDGKDIGQPFKQLYLFEHFSAATFHAATFYYIYKNLTQVFDIERYIYTYENNSWERMAIMALRKHSPKTRIVAHQHNVVLLESANMFYGRGEKEHSPGPDVILTTGQRTKSILENYGHYPAGMVMPACAVRYGYLNDLKPLGGNRNKKVVLVALGGVVSEAELMLRTLADKACALNGWRVIVRCHPVLAHKSLDKKYDIPFSHKLSLAKDIQEASVVLYRGSTVALEAIKQGLAVIHFADGMSSDPLFELSSFKWRWNPQLPLWDVLVDIENMEDSHYQNLKEKAQDYLRDYFHHVTPERLELFATA